MKKDFDENLIEIKNFFKLLCFDQNATKEEVNHFLWNCLKYVFNQEGLNINNYKIYFHFVKEEDKFKKTKKQQKKEVLNEKLFSNLTKAVLMKDDDDKTLFDIYFPAQFASVKVSLEENHKKRTKTVHSEDEDKNHLKTIQRIQNVDEFLDFIFTVFHEYAHMIQYIKQEKIMNEYDENDAEMKDAQEAIKYYMPKGKKKRLILKTLDKYFDAQGYVAQYEQDADTQAYEYFISLVLKLINNTKNQEFFDFLGLVISFLNQIKNNLKINYDIYEKLNAEAIDKLGTLNFEDELEEIMKELEGC